MAQFLLVYGEEEELFRAVGENSEFDYIIMRSDDLDTNAEIRVKSGTSMPVDNPQRRATADKAASQLMIDPLTYWEIMDQPNAEKYAKRVMTLKPTLTPLCKTPKKSCLTVMLILTWKLLSTAVHRLTVMICQKNTLIILIRLCFPVIWKIQAYQWKPAKL
jgi:hypothetical protein